MAGKSFVCGCPTMSALIDTKSRTDMLNRLKRAEGQLRGVQRMIEQGEPCLDIAGQMSAVRKALDSAYMFMTVCFMQQELHSRLGDDKAIDGRLDAVMSDVQDMLNKLR